MKTSVNMVRKLGNLEVVQRTKDGYFDANILLNQWNKLGNKRQRMSEFLESSKTKEFISEIETQSRETDNAINQIVIIKKGRHTKNGKTKDEVWMHPYLFIDYAMHINPKFKYSVIKFVYDQLIEFRHSAGDMYRGLTNSLMKFKDVNYSQVAKGLNWITFDKHESGIRQLASQGQLKELTDLQKKLAFAIDMGYIKSYDQLIKEMRKLYNVKYSKF